jgi:hypothetical protein
LRVTVPVDDVPPVTLDGLNATLDGAAAVTVTVPEAEPPLYVPVTVTLKLAVTITDLIEMEALVAPAGTVMLDGINPPVGMLVVSVTTAPPAGAGPLSVAVNDVD